MAGGSVSLMFTVNEHVAVPAELEAEQVTVFVPTEKAVPDGGTQLTAGSGKPFALGVKVSIAEH